jgi:hypothetical protein
MKKLLRLLAEVDQRESLYLYQRTSLVPSVIEGHRFRTDHKRSFSESSRSHLIRKIRIRQRLTRGSNLIVVLKTGWTKRV